MKKIFPEVPDVSQSMANRATRIVERHLRLHRVNRVNELPEEAKVRLYRDLRFFIESEGQPPSSEQGLRGLGIRGFFSKLWEKIEDFLSMSEDMRGCGPITIFTWSYFGESPRFAFGAWGSQSQSCDDTC